MDHHPVHHAQPVQDWLVEYERAIELVFLPSYSPQLNPVEYLDGDVKQEVHSKAPSWSFDQLQHCVLISST